MELLLTGPLRKVRAQLRAELATFITAVDRGDGAGAERALMRLMTRASALCLWIEARQRTRPTRARRRSPRPTTTTGRT